MVRIAKNHEYIEFKIGKEIYKVLLSDISYFSSCGRKITLHGNHQEYEFYESMKNIYDTLKDKGFVDIHKSFIVNRIYIKKAEYERVILNDGKVLPISQSKRPHIRKQFKEFRLR